MAQIILESLLKEKSLKGVNDLLKSKLFPPVNEVMNYAGSDKVRQSAFSLMKKNILMIASRYDTDLLEDFIEKYAEHITECVENFKNNKKKIHDREFSKISLEDVDKYFSRKFYMIYGEQREKGYSE